LKIVVLDSAKEHLIEGFSFYEKQSPELGTYFLDSLFADIDSLALYAGIHLSFNGYQRCHARRFPFAIYYLIQLDEIRVFAVLDSRRRPSFIKRRLPKI
jgi:plasmid stabilization system protein ParE